MDRAGNPFPRPLPSRAEARKLPLLMAGLRVRVPPVPPLPFFRGSSVAERPPVKRLVAGSIPALEANGAAKAPFSGRSAAEARLIWDQEVASSILAVQTNGFVAQWESSPLARGRFRVRVPAIPPLRPRERGRASARGRTSEVLTRSLEGVV